MEAVLIFLLFAGVVVSVAAPLFRGTRGSENTSQVLAALEAEKLTLYRQIKQTDNEFELGLLSEEDYTSLRNRLKLEAARVIDKIDAARN